MEKRSNISPAQLAMIGGGSAAVVAYTFMPIVDGGIPDHEALYVLLLSFAYVAVLNLPVLFLTARFRNMTLNQTFEVLTGKFVGKAAAAVIALVFMLQFLIVLNINVAYIKTYILTNTPEWALLVVTLAPVVYAAYKGGGTLGRIGIVVLPVMFTAVVLFFILGLEQMKLEDVYPLLKPPTFVDMNKYAFFNASRYSEIYLFFIFGTYLQKKSGVIKPYVCSFVIYVVSVLLITLPTLIVIGVPLSKLYLNPYFIYCRQVGRLDFIQKLQSINILTWYMAAIFRMGLYFYGASLLTAGIVKKKKYKFFILPLAAVAFIICLVPKLSNMYFLSALTESPFLPCLIAAVVFVLPLILCAVALIRKKHIDNVLTTLAENVDDRIDEQEQEILAEKSAAG
ncbi:MAG: GerAB/ArcD/ProY family transporter [Clostridiales bacterium]|jgi:spore germination protein KB|nr:GerAB/ArcD/ProY family transporter [Clostridiales bacterium]